MNSCLSCRFPGCSSWHRLSYLDVSYNEIDRIDSARIKVTHDIETQAKNSLDQEKGVDYEGNPILKVELSLVTSKEVTTVLSRLFRSQQAAAACV